MKRIFSLSILLFCLILGISSCKREADSRKTVAVSLPPQASLLKDIVGDSLDIVTLMRTDANPESFEVTVKDMRAIADADIYMKAGHLSFEESLTQRLSESNNSLRFVDVSEGITPIMGTHSHGGHTHDVPDPHTWTSIPNLKVIAANMLSAVNDIDPANKEYYTANYNMLVSRLDSLNQSVATRLAGAETKSFLIWHPSLSYYARDYGLEQIPLGQDNKEMTPMQLRAIYDHASAEGVAVIFIQKNYDARQAEGFANELGVPVVQINPLDDNYLRQFNIITDALTR